VYMRAGFVPLGESNMLRRGSAKVEGSKVGGGKIDSTVVQAA
jgi:hypothetical protein